MLLCKRCMCDTDWGGGRALDLVLDLQLLPGDHLKLGPAEPRTVFQQSFLLLCPGLPGGWVGGGEHSCRKKKAPGIHLRFVDSSETNWSRDAFILLCGRSFCQYWYQLWVLKRESERSSEIGESRALYSASPLSFSFLKYLFIWLHQVLVAACKLNCSMWNLVPWPQTQPRPPFWMHRVLAVRPPENSPHLFLIGISQQVISPLWKLPFVQIS